jgi:hypothetical protein
MQIPLKGSHEGAGQVESKAGGFGSLLKWLE